MSRRTSLEEGDGAAFPFLAGMLNLAPLVHGRTPDDLRTIAARQFADKYQKYLVSRAEGTDSHVRFHTETLTPVQPSVIPVDDGHSRTCGSVRFSACIH